MHVFVAGATGAIGRRLVPLLVSRGHAVTAMTRRPERAELLLELGAEPVIADAFDASAVAEAMTAARPDAVMHQLTDLGAGDFAANARLRVEGTRNLVRAAREAGVRRIVAQSIAWAYEPGLEPADEEVALDLSAEGSRGRMVAAVAALEFAVRELPEWVVLRYGLLYGPGTWYSRDGLYGEEARAGRLHATRDCVSFVHVDDAAAAAAEALAWPSGVVNVCDDEPATGLDWVPAFAAAVDAPPPPRDGMSAHPRRQAWARGADNRRARRELGWSPSFPSWRHGFQSER